MNIKRIHILLLCLLVVIIFALPGQASANDSQLDRYTIYLESPAHHDDWVKTLNERNIKLVYSVEEIGLYQIEGRQKEVQELAAEINYINSHNQSVAMQPASLHNTAPAEATIFGGTPTLWDDFQWDMRKATNNGQTYQITEGSKNTIVGIIDSGIDMNHPDLKENILSVRNFVPKGGLRGQEPYEKGDINDSTDYLGHGTFVAGQIAANGLMKGIAPETGIRSYRVFGGKSAGAVWISDAIIQAAIDDVDMINVSFGTFLVKQNRKNKQMPDTNDLAEIKAFKKAVSFAHKKGSAVVASIGNEGLDLKDKNAVFEYWRSTKQEDLSADGKVILIPAQLPNVVTVSSIGPSGMRSVFSNYGKNVVDIAADGGDLRLLNEVGEDRYYGEGLFRQEYILGAAPGVTYTFSIGTSIAAPKVSGALALLIDQKQLHDKPDKAVKILLKNADRNADKIDTGAGVLNVYRALTD